MATWAWLKSIEEFETYLYIYSGNLYVCTTITLSLDLNECWTFYGWSASKGIAKAAIRGSKTALLTHISAFVTEKYEETISFAGNRTTLVARDEHDYCMMLYGRDFIRVWVYLRTQLNSSSSKKKTFGRIIIHVFTSVCFSVNGFIREWVVQKPHYAIRKWAPAPVRFVRACIFTFFKIAFLLLFLLMLFFLLFCKLGQGLLKSAAITGLRCQNNGLHAINTCLQTFVWPLWPMSCTVKLNFL